MAGKGEIVDRVAAKTGKKKTEVAQVIDEMLSEINGSLDNGEAVTLRGFGTFRVRERAARKGRNPRTGEEITIPASKVVSFKQSK